MVDFPICRDPVTFAFIGVSSLCSSSLGNWLGSATACCTLTVPAERMSGLGKGAKEALGFGMFPSTHRELLLREVIEAQLEEITQRHRRSARKGDRLVVAVPCGTRRHRGPESTPGVQIIDEWDLTDGFAVIMARAQMIAATHLHRMLATGPYLEEAFSSLVVETERVAMRAMKVPRGRSFGLRSQYG